MGSCYSVDHIAGGHVYTDITACNTEEPQQKHRRTSIIIVLYFCIIFCLIPFNRCISQSLHTLLLGHKVSWVYRRNFLLLLAFPGRIISTFRQNVL